MEKTIKELNENFKKYSNIIQENGGVLAFKDIDTYSQFKKPKYDCFKNINGYVFAYEANKDEVLKTFSNNEPLNIETFIKEILPKKRHLNLAQWQIAEISEETVKDWNYKMKLSEEVKNEMKNNKELLLEELSKPYINLIKEINEGIIEQGEDAWGIVHINEEFNEKLVRNPMVDELVRLNKDNLDEFKKTFNNLNFLDQNKIIDNIFKETFNDFELRPILDDISNDKDLISSWGLNKNIFNQIQIKINDEVIKEKEAYDKKLEFEENNHTVKNKFDLQLDDIPF